MAEAGGGGEGGAPRRPTDAYMARKNVVSTIPEERRLIITELVMSELKYVQDLELIRTLFLEPIRSNKLLELMDFMMLFSNIEIIEQTNRELLKTLQDLVGSSTDILALCIGDVFLRQIEELLPVYTPYCLNQAQSVETYDRLMSKKGPFSDFVKKMMVEPKAQGLPMMSYLIKPVQRLCKYPLLLRELLNKTNNSHPDRKPLERALL
ncbi:MAG: RhoGEF domain-containing protein, partial [archaeon]|nr:RhoGEF domain-containing protein [archaeon]